MPYTTPLGQVYDSGDFASVMDEALEVADWYGFETRRKAATAEGSYAGIGVACFVEPAGGWRSQRADLRFHPDGTLTRSEEHTSELQSLMRISYAVFCLKKKKHKQPCTTTRIRNNTY